MRWCSAICAHAPEGAARQFLEPFPALAILRSRLAMPPEGALSRVLYPLFGILLLPVIAAAAMALSSVSVVGNALRLRTARIG